MKQPEDRATVDWCDADDDTDPQTWPRVCTLYCRHCRTTARGVLVQRLEGPPACSRCGELRPGIIEERPAAMVANETGKPKARGAYAGAVKIGCGNHAARARTRLSQAEFARLAGVSERTLRTWERGDTVSAESRMAIGAALNKFEAPQAPRKPVRYYDQHTGQSWSGRGLMPRWMRAELDKGRRLADFERPA